MNPSSRYDPPPPLPTTPTGPGTQAPPGVYFSVCIRVTEATGNGQSRYREHTSYNAFQAVTLNEDGSVLVTAAVAAAAISDLTALSQPYGDTAVAGAWSTVNPDAQFPTFAYLGAGQTGVTYLLSPDADGYYCLPPDTFRAVLHHRNFDTVYNTAGALTPARTINGIPVENTGRTPSNRTAVIMFMCTPVPTGNTYRGGRADLRARPRNRFLNHTLDHPDGWLPILIAGGQSVSDGDKGTPHLLGVLAVLARVTGNTGLTAAAVDRALRLDEDNDLALAMSRVLAGEGGMAENLDYLHLMLLPPLPPGLLDGIDPLAVAAAQGPLLTAANISPVTSIRKGTS